MELESCTSTQEVLKDFWSNGRAKHGDWVSSLLQTSGRGRQGHVWYSPAGQLFVSALIVPKENLQKRLTWVSLLSALALLESLQDFPSVANLVKIKWPNDLWTKKGKVGGILSESVGGAVICGLGLNLENIPQSIQSELGRPFDYINISRVLIRDAWLKHFLKIIEQFETSPIDWSGSNLEKDLELVGWKERVQQYFWISKGAKITWGGNVPGSGKYLGLGSWGELITDSKKLFTEEVSDLQW